MIRGRVCAEPSLIGADASVPVFVSLGLVLRFVGPGRGCSLMRRVDPSQNRRIYTNHDNVMCKRLQRGGLREGG